MKDLHIVGVHGIRQRDTNSIRLGDDWGEALARGMRSHVGPGAQVPMLTTPYYGDVFPRTWSKLGEDDTVPDPAQMTPDELDFLLQALQAHTPADPTAPTATLGMPPRIPPAAVRLLASIDKAFGHGMGKIVLSRISEVHGYLTDHDLAERVRTRIREAIDKTAPRMIIAHSLGSIVVYDMFQRGQIPSSGPGGVSMLITCGSPWAGCPSSAALGCRGTCTCRPALPGSTSSTPSTASPQAKACPRLPPP